MRIRGLIGKTIALGAAVSMLAACGGDDKDTGSGGSGATVDTVNVSLATDPTSLDPAMVTSPADAAVSRAFYDSLVRLDKDGNPVAALATSWKLEPSRVVFTVRTDVLCSDGSPVTVKHMADSIARYVNPATKAPLAPLAFGGRTVTVTADEAAKTVTVATSTPWSDIVNAVAQPNGGVICGAGWSDPASLATKPSGSGPFTLESSTRGSSYTLKRRTDYRWAPDLPAPKGDLPTTVVYKVMANESTQANLLLSGGLELGIFDGPDSKRFDGNDDFDTATLTVGSSVLMFNQVAGRPLADEATRKAVAQAIDRASYIDAALQGIGKPVSSIAHDGTRCVDTSLANRLPKKDTAAATSVLRGKKLVILNNSRWSAGGEYLLEALKAAGADVSLNNADGNTTNGILLGGGGNWDISPLFVQNSYQTLSAPGGFFLGGTPPNGVNISSAKNPAYEAAYVKATTTLGEESCKAWTDAQRALVDDMNLLPLSTFDVVFVQKSPVAAAAYDGLIEPSSIRVD